MFFVRVNGYVISAPVNVTANAPSVLLGISVDKTGECRCTAQTCRMARKHRSIENAANSANAFTFNSAEGHMSTLSLQHTKGTC